MHKRTFLKSAALLGAAGVVQPLVGVSAPWSVKSAAPFELPPLPYGVADLEPHIDQATMEIHHGKHHQGYTNKLNAAVANTPYATMSIEKLLSSISEDDTTLRNNGGGYYNHLLFWKFLSPQGGGPPDGDVADAINRSFGSYEQMQEQFNQAATTQFGSGWAWLLTDGQGNLSITATPNQDNALMSFTEASGRPILGLDVWEHAYYLKYQNRRADYVQAFWNLVDWTEVAQQLNPS